MAIPQLFECFRAEKPGLIPSTVHSSTNPMSCFSSPGALSPVVQRAGSLYCYVMNNRQKLAILLLTFTLCAGCFYWRFAMWLNTPKQHLMSWTFPVAKGCGQAMKVTFSLILLPVSRNFITWARCVRGTRRSRFHAP